MTVEEKRWYEPEEEKSYELQWLEAERDLVILEYENAKWLAGRKEHIFNS